MKDSFSKFLSKSRVLTVRVIKLTCTCIFSHGLYILFGTLIAAYEPPLNSAEINYQDFIT